MVAGLGMCGKRRHDVLDFLTSSLLAVPRTNCMKWVIADYDPRLNPHIANILKRYSTTMSNLFNIVSTHEYSKHRLNSQFRP